MARESPQAENHGSITGHCWCAHKNAKFRKVVHRVPIGSAPETFPEIDTNAERADLRDEEEWSLTPLSSPASNLLSASPVPGLFFVLNNIFPPM